MRTAKFAQKIGVFEPKSRRSLQGLILLLSAGSLASLSACISVGPDYETQVTNTSIARFPSDIQPLAEVSEQLWWTENADPQLAGLIEEAMQANQDLAEATARVRASRALLRETRSARYPSIDLESSASFNRQSVASFGFPGVQAEDQLSPSTTVSASWEIDLFGRIARQLQSARADAEASEANRRDLARLISADVALAYLDLREAQTRISVADDNLENQKRTLEITNTLEEGGKASRLDTARAEALVASTEARLPQFRAQAVSARNRLTTLLGLEPGALDARLSPPADLPVFPAFVSIGTPSSLIARRPDVRAAERTLAAASARIGVATADLYPTITLTGSTGLSSAEVADFGSQDAFSYAIGPRIRWNIFDRGAVYARIEQADANEAANLARFRQTVLTALEEVDSALALYNEEAVRLAKLTTSRNASAEAKDLATARFELGREPFLTVLDAERVLLAADDEVVVSSAARLRAQIQLYRAVAGGWTESFSTEQATPAEMDP